MIICVLGMHRSGTSLVAGMLSGLGVYLGAEERLLGPGPDNPKGFWEHKQLLEINDAILCRLGGSWHEPPASPLDLRSDPKLHDLRQRAEALIAEEFVDQEAWAWKDPRMCLTVSFWQPLLPAMQYVVCLREPRDVAASLMRRDRFPPEKSLRLWLTYLQSALKHTASEQRCFVCYEDFIADGYAELQQMCYWLGKPEWAEGPELRAGVQGFVDPGLRHHNSSALDPVDMDKLPPAARAMCLAEEVYQSLKRTPPKQSDVDDMLQVALETLAGASQALRLGRRIDRALRLARAAAPSPRPEETR